MRSHLIRPLSLFFCALAICAIPIRAQLPPVKLAPLQSPAGESACSVQSACADVAPGMIRSAQGPSPMEENLRHLTDEIGGRVSGSPAAEKAAGWASKRSATRAWTKCTPKNTRFRWAGPRGRRAWKFWRPSRSRCGWFRSAGRPQRLKAGSRRTSWMWDPATKRDLRRRARGERRDRVGPFEIFWSLGTSLSRSTTSRRRSLTRAVKGGAEAVLWMSSRPNLLLYRHTDSVDGELEKMQQAVVAREDARAHRAIFGGGPAGARAFRHAEQNERPGGIAKMWWRKFAGAKSRTNSWCLGRISIPGSWAPARSTTAATPRW